MQLKLDNGGKKLLHSFGVKDFFLGEIHMRQSPQSTAEVQNQKRSVN